MKYRVYANAKSERVVELKAAPNKAGKTTIRYTTDGADPKLSGGVYDAPVPLTRGTHLVLAYAECQGVQSDPLTIQIDWGKKDIEEPIDVEKPAKWRKTHEYFMTLESYQLISQLERHEAKASGIRVGVTGDRWLQLDFHPQVQLDAAQLTGVLTTLRALPVTADGQVQLRCDAIHFLTGQRLLDWLNEAKVDVKPGEVEQ
jgi:hypothetical protein